MLKLDKKLASLDAHQYDEKDIYTWSENVRAYLIGQNSAMLRFLLWIEQFDKATVTMHHVVSLNVLRGIETCDLDYVRASEQLWSWLNLTIGPKQSSARRDFKLTEQLNGAELWRKLVRPTSNKSLQRRNLLRDKIQMPKRAPSMAVVMDYIKLWEQDNNLYEAAGGASCCEEVRINQLLKILPSALSMEMLMKASDLKTSADLLEWVDLKATFIQEHSGGGHREAHLAETESQLQAPGEEDHPEDSEEWNQEENDAVLLWLQGATDEEALAFARAGGWRTKGSGKGRFGQRKGGGKGNTRFGTSSGPRFPGAANIPPRGASDMACVNCGEKGHTAPNCPKPRNEMGQRPCFGCGKLGHRHAQCKTRPPTAGARPLGQARIADGQSQLAIADGKLQMAVAGSRPQWNLTVSTDGHGRTSTAGKPYDPVVDSQGRPLLQGGYVSARVQSIEHGNGQTRAPPNRPQPRIIQIKDYLVPRKPTNKPRGGSRYRPLESDDLTDDDTDDDDDEVKASANLSYHAYIHSVNTHPGHTDRNCPIVAE